MMNLEFFQKLNPSIVLKLIEKDNLVKSENLNDTKLLFLLKTKRYSEIKEIIEKLSLQENIKNYLSEKIKFLEDNSNKYFSNLKENILNFYNDSKKYENEFVENNYSKKSILNYNSFENISYSDNLFSESLNLALYLFNINNLKESLNILNILENINRYNKQEELNIFWGQFYIYFLLENYEKAYELLVNKILKELKLKNYNINIYSSFVKYLYLLDFYLNKEINYNLWLELYNLKGFGKSIELDTEYLLPHLILVKINKNENLNSIVKIFKLYKIDKKKNIFYEFLFNYFENIVIDENLILNIEKFLSNSFIYKKYSETILENIKIYLLNYLSKILEKISFEELSKIFNFKLDIELEKWLINVILENNIDIEIKGKSIEFKFNQKINNNQKEDIYKKAIELVESYKN